MRISEATEAEYSTGLWITDEVPTGIVLWYAVDITNSRREVVLRAVITVGHTARNEKIVKYVLCKL